MRVLVGMVFVFCMFLGACPPASDKSSGNGVVAKPAGCAKFGDSCEFSPGKLGSCVHKDDCTVEPCLVCQSQH